MNAVEQIIDKSKKIIIVPILSNAPIKKQNKDAVLPLDRKSWSSN